MGHPWERDWMKNLHEDNGPPVSETNRDQSDAGRPVPARLLDLVAGYYRNYAIFCAVFALGLALASENNTSGGLLSHLDYGDLPGMPDAALVSAAGYLLMGMAIALSLWNLGATLIQWCRKPVGHWAGGALIGFTYVMGAIIPYGLVMILIDKL